jgi:hypothetical protein
MVVAAHKVSSSSKLLAGAGSAATCGGFGVATLLAEISLSSNSDVTIESIIFFNIIFMVDSSVDILLLISSSLEALELKINIHV